MRLYMLIYFFCTLAFLIKAQQPDSLSLHRDSIPAVVSDSLVAQKKRTGGISAPLQQPQIAAPDSAAVAKKRESFYARHFTKNYPNPRTAALLSFILPGAGQAYNKKWWKIPIVYGALGGMTWLALKNDKQYKALKSNYKWVVDGDDSTNPTEEPYIFMSEAQLKSYRDIYRGYTEKSYLFLGITYLLAATDAFVDAHLKTFDVSDDLSLRVVPAIQSAPGAFGASFGVGLRLGIGKPSSSAFSKKNIFVAP
jgi:Family of unknown function (DUF5683)